MFLALTAAAFAAHAEGVGSDPKAASSGDRLYGATTILPAADGLISLGGASLRRLPAGSRRWETVHTVPGDNSYRVAADDKGRLLAAWEKEPLIHLFSPAQRQHTSFPKPAAPSPDVTDFQISSLEMAPDGRSALVFMTGNVRITTGRFRGPSWSTSVYRVALDANAAGTLEAKWIVRVDHGYRLHTSPFGAVFAMPKNPGQTCDHRSCSVGAIVAYEITPDGVSTKTLFVDDTRQVGRARLVRGSDDRRVAVMLDASTPRSLELLRWRYGDANAQFRTLPWPAREDLTTLLLTSRDELVEIRRGDDRLEVFRHGTAGAEPIATLGALQAVDNGLFGVGERSDGGLWVHWGDHLGLLSPGKPARSFSLEPLLPRRSEWAGDAYVKGSEQLWVGIDGRGRDFVRVSFADAEKRAKPWPGASITGVTGSGAEGAVSYAKDPSTKDRLVATDSLRAVPGGLISIGGKALRRLTPGSARWEVLHEVKGDSLYRVAADDSGRLLASWEKEPVIHFFSPAQGQHVTLPKPTLVSSVNGQKVNGLSVQDLQFAANGRDALVFSQGQIGASSRWITAAHWVALDGRSEPRPIFRVDEGVKLVTCRRGAVFAIPRDARQECSHQTCWPIGAIVAYEISGDQVSQRTLLAGDAADMSRAKTVYGSDEEGVGLVLDLVKVDGPRRLNGGRALLRWRWGDARADYRTLPGIGSLTPVWWMTKTNDFVEVVQKHDGEGERLEVRRYLAGMGEQVTSLGRLEPGASPYGVGERRDGGLWLQWGEHLALLPAGKPPRRLKIEQLLQRGWEWAGAHVYVETPESLWVGLDGRGRQFVRVDLAEADRRSQPWR